MILILDVETTFTDGDNTPYNLNNKLVSVGINSKYFFFYHQSIDESTHQETFNKIQKFLPLYIISFLHIHKSCLLYILHLYYLKIDVMVSTM